MIPEWLLLVSVLAHIAPEHVAAALEHSIAAWEYVGSGIEATCLYLAVYMQAEPRMAWPLLAVCSYGVFESVQRPACRLMHPMTQRVPLQPGQTLCDAAGISTASMSVVAALLAISVVAHRQRTSA